MKKLTEKEIRAGGAAMADVLKTMKDLVVKQEITGLAKTGDGQEGLILGSTILYADMDDEQNGPGVWCLITGRSTKTFTPVTLAETFEDLYVGTVVKAFGYYPYGFGVVPYITLEDPETSVKVALGVFSDEEGNAGGVISLEEKDSGKSLGIACQFQPKDA